MKQENRELELIFGKDFWNQNKEEKKYQSEFEKWFSDTEEVEEESENVPIFE